MGHRDHNGSHITPVGIGPTHCAFTALALRLARSGELTRHKSFDHHCGACQLQLLEVARVRVQINATY